MNTYFITCEHTVVFNEYCSMLLDTNISKNILNTKQQQHHIAYFTIK